MRVSFREPEDKRTSDEILRELIEQSQSLNEERITELSEILTKEFRDKSTEIDQKALQLESKLLNRIAKMEEENAHNMAYMERKIHESKNETIKWIMVLWISMLVVVIIAATTFTIK